MATRLDRERVVGTALRVLNEVGLEGLTLRKIAGELQVQAPALYWHFKNKEELLDEMATTMLRELTRASPGVPVAGWSEVLGQAARGLRRMMLGYRDGAKVFSGTRMTDPSLYAFLDAMLRPLVDAGLSPGDAACAYSTVYNYTVGFTIEEQAVHPMPGEHNAQYDLERRSQAVDGERFPLAQAVGETLFTGFDDRFERGLGLILRGVEQLLAHGR